MTEPTPTVFIVDDDEPVRDAIGMLLDISAVMTQLSVLVPLLVVLFAVKVAVVTLSVLAVGGRLSTALISGLTEPFQPTGVLDILYL